MKKIAEDFLGETVSRAVVTVPAYFSDAQVGAHRTHHHRGNGFT